MHPILLRAQSVLSNATAHPHRIAGLAFGIVLPLLAAGLILAPKGGGLSDARGGDARPPAFVVQVD